MNLINRFYNQNQSWARLVITAFVISLALGVVAGFYYPDYMEEILATFSERFGNNPALDLNLARQIFLQNAMVAAIALFGGLVLGIAPLLVVVFNGFIIGYIGSYFISIGGNPGLLLLGLLPHGVVEIPAFLMAAILGLRWGLGWLMPPAAGQRWAIFIQDTKLALKLVPVIVLALVFAALVEVFITGSILQ